MPNPLESQRKFRINVNVNSRLRIRRTLNSTNGYAWVATLCKLLTTYLVCKTFYNLGDPLHMCNVHLRVRVAVKFDPRYPLYRRVEIL